MGSLLGGDFDIELPKFNYFSFGKYLGDVFKDSYFQYTLFKCTTNIIYTNIKHKVNSNLGPEEEYIYMPF
jgi:hypothetical protein